MFNFFKRENKKSKKDMGEKHLSEIKKFFDYYHGDEMAMDREDSEKYKRYRLISDDIIEKWRQELIDYDFELLSSKNDVKNTWSTVGDLLRLIFVSRTKQESNSKRLLTEIIDTAPILDKCQKILILEHFAGRTAHQKDGGIYLVHTKTNLTELLTRVIDVLSDFQTDVSDSTEEIGWEDMELRYTAVNNSIQNAYIKFGITSH